jgi:anti-anti-sigma factor
MFALSEVLCQKVHVIHVDGPLRSPVSDDLHRRIRQSLCRGAGTIVLDLSRIPYLDAAGIGELVRAYNMIAAANGSLRIANASRRARRVLGHVGLFDLMGARTMPDL